MSLVHDRPGADPTSRHEDAAALGEELARLMRVMQTIKGQLTCGDGDEVERERAAHLLLFPLGRLGPLRLGALAELVHADPSTVSRHVGLLVKRGLVRRIADEDDGRASRLLVTEDGAIVLDGMRHERAALLARSTAAWSRQDLQAFSGLLRRFVQDLDEHTAVRACGSTAPMGGKHA